MWEETDYAWAAGIIDGEGTLGMLIARSGVNRRLTTAFQINIRVRMTCRDTIQKLATMFDGKVTYTKARDILRHKDTYSWGAIDLKVIEVLNRTAKYMVTKKEQAKLLLEYRERCCFERPIGRNRVNAAIVERRMEYYLKLRELNKKGPKGE